jgi:hypothetical protein
VFELGVDDCVEVAWLVAAGVADGLLAFGVGPAGAVGDQLPVVADEESADDLGECAELSVRGVDQTGADVVPEPKVAAGRVGLAGAGLCAALLVVGGGVAEFVVVDPRAGEAGLLAGLRRVVVRDLLVDDVDHEAGRPDIAPLLIGVAPVEPLVRPVVDAARSGPRVTLAGRQAAAERTPALVRARR